MRNILKSLKDRHRDRCQRRRSALACEQLENRVVLTSGVSTSLLGSLSYVGVVTSPQVSLSIPILPILPILPPRPNFPMAASASITTWSKLGTDLQTLTTELQSLAGKSGVTIADLQSLTTDSQSIAQAGFRFQVKSLNSTISELATAVAGGTSTSQAQTDFTALFSGSSVSTATINSTFTDLVQTIHDSAVTTSDLSTVATDEAAIQADLPKLPIWWLPGDEPWLDQVGIAPADITVAPSVVTPIPEPGLPITEPSPITFSLPPLVLPWITSPGTVTVSPPIPVSSLIAVPPIISPSSITVPPAIIISPYGGAGLLGALSSVGVVTSPVIVNPPITILPPVAAIPSGPFSQLQTDVRTLESELQNLAAKSGLTIADLQNLVNDGQAINQAGFYFNLQSLDKVVSELGTAVAGGSSTTQAQTDFTSLFSSSSVSTTTINTAFNDLVKAVQDFEVLPTDLTTVAADQAAIQADLKNLFSGKSGGSGTGTGTGTTGTGTTGSGSNAGSNGHKRSHGHKVRHETYVAPKTAIHPHSKTLARSKKR